MKTTIIAVLMLIGGTLLGGFLHHKFVPPKTIIHNVEVLKEVPAPCPIAPSCPAVNPAPRGLITDPEFRWQVPDNTRSVVVRILEKNGRLIQEYEISRFITIRPGQKLHLLSK